MNETGDCDPKLVFNFGSSEIKTTSNSTYNPIWNEVLEMSIET